MDFVGPTRRIGCRAPMPAEVTAVRVSFIPVFGVACFDELRLALLKARPMLQEQLLEDRAVTPGLVCAVAPHREGCVMRQGSQEPEQPCCRRTLHLAPVAFDEALPRSSIASSKRDLDELV